MASHMQLPQTAAVTFAPNCCCYPASTAAPQVTAQSLDDAANATDPNPLDVPATLLLSGRYAASALLAELAAAEAPADPNPGSLDDYLFGAGVLAAPEESGELGCYSAVAGGAADHAVHGMALHGMPLCTCSLSSSRNISALNVHSCLLVFMLQRARCLSLIASASWPSERLAISLCCQRPIWDSCAPDLQAVRLLCAKALPTWPPPSRCSPIFALLEHCRVTAVGKGWIEVDRALPYDLRLQWQVNCASAGLWRSWLCCGWLWQLACC